MRSRIKFSSFTPALIYNLIFGCVCSIIISLVLSVTVHLPKSGRWYFDGTMRRAWLDGRTLGVRIVLFGSGIDRSISMFAASEGRSAYAFAMANQYVDKKFPAWIPSDSDLEFLFRDAPKNDARFQIVSFGFPLPCFTYYRHIAPDGSRRERFAWKLTWRSSGRQIEAVIPMQPAVGPFVFNSVSCGFSFWCIWNVFRLAQRMWRRHRACCPTCGYSLRGLEVRQCPECGNFRPLVSAQ